MKTKVKENLTSTATSTTTTSTTSTRGYFGSQLFTPRRKFKSHKVTFPYAYLFSKEQKMLLKELHTLLFNDFRYSQMVRHEDFLYAKGDIPIMLVAHVDTVHRTLPVVRQDQKKGVLWAKEGIGADDRAGVAAILELLKRGHRPHVLFCDYEETGGRGAREATKHLKEVDVDFLIEFDRKGSNDSVYYDCANTEFEEFINGFGFETDHGSFSDISILCPAFGVAGVNLSTGYYNAHTLNEYLVIKEWESVIDRAEKILTAPSKKYEYVESPYYSKYYGMRDPYEDDTLSMTIGAGTSFSDINASMYISDVMDYIGFGSYHQWVSYFSRNRRDIRCALEDKIYEIVIDFINENPPDFIYDDEEEEDRCRR